MRITCNQRIEGSKLLIAHRADNSSCDQSYLLFTFSLVTSDVIMAILSFFFVKKKGGGGAVKKSLI